LLGLRAPQPVAEVPQPPTGYELIAYGPLLSDDGVSWLGTIALLRAASADEARSVLAEDGYAEVEVHPWVFGGRR
jgi:hypothetical protein